jgi:hypothetical protein
MPFYNTSSPTPTTKNTINSVTVGYGIRDYLLNLNLVPTGPYALISTSLNGSPRIGEPVLDTMVGSGNVVVPIGLPLEVNGIIFKDNNISVNNFQNTSSNADTLTQIEYISPIQNIEFGSAYWPQGIQQYPTSVNDEVEEYGIVGKTNIAQYRKKNTIKNLYLDVTKQIDMADFITLNPMDITQQVSGYLDEYGNLNLGNSGGIQAANIIGSFLNGQGVGISSNGVVPNFDIRASLAGRVLGGTGLLNDTKLGKIGAQQLALALANNAAFNVQEELLGSLNLSDNILSLIKGNGFAGFPRPSYKITIPQSGLGRVLDTAGSLLGFSIPRSYLDDAGSIFQAESGGNIDNVTRANKMLLNTGKGQIQALLTNIRANQIGTGQYDNPNSSPFRVGYAPGYTNNKGEVQITDSIIYAFNKEGNLINLFGSDDGIIPNISYNRVEMVKSSGFITPEDTFTGPRGNTGYNERKISDIGFTWTTGNGGMVNSTTEFDEFLGDKKSLLSKTQKLFNSKGMKNIVTAKGDMDKFSSQIQTANGNGFSKGNAVMKADMFDKDTGRYIGKKDATADETYCRSWTTLDRYDSVSKLVRSGIDNINNGLTGPFDFIEKYGNSINTTVPYRFNTQGSVLGGYGFPKIAPYSTDSIDDPKKYMFSIENLAWNDDVENLPTCERGPGDLISGKKGRIMWFPPYNIQFSENSNVNWEKTDFIGRGESVYTYNNTERSGNLSFQIIVDHPSYINAFRGPNGPDDHYVNSFWAGCIDPDSKWAEKLTVSERSEIVKDNLTIPQQKVIPKEEGFNGLKVYFPNDNSAVNPKYENGLSGSSFSETIDYTINPQGEGFGLAGGSVADTTQKAIKGKTLRWTDRYNFGLNYSTNSPNKKFFTIGDVTVNGFFDPNTLPSLATFLTTKCKYCKVVITGYASKQGFTTTNIELAKKRGEKVKKYLLDNLKPLLLEAGLTEDAINKRFLVNPGEEVTANTGCPRQTKEVPDPPTDSIACKTDRYVTISVVPDSKLAEEEIAQPEPVITPRTRRIDTKIKNRFYTECNYFEQLTDADPFVFDRFRDKIKYFHPAFHSTTPEGLNSRLTFLLQCTRQGRTLEDLGANNLAFGRAPVCILRIGDFYNTKIIIDNVSIDYEPLVWDLNPEGVGIQPMIANISMSFKFIGGSTLMGPINKLQNALSFNYFANTHVYDPRADYISLNKPETKVKTKVVNGVVETEVIGTRTSETGYYINNIVDDVYGGDVNRFIESDVTTTETIIDNTPQVDQGVANENAVATQNTDQTTGTSGLTTFSLVDITATFGTTNEYVFQIGINSTGFFTRDGSTYNWQVDYDGPEFKTWVEKGIKIRLLKNNTLIVEELAVFGGNNESKKAYSLMTNSFFLGDKTPDFGTGVIKGLAEGSDYVLECWYNGNRVASLNVSVNQNQPFFKYYNIK